MIENPRNTLDLFEWFSGQKINWEKSALCVINVEEHKLFSMATKIKVEQLSFLYLGLPQGGHPKKVSFWKPIIDKLQGKLDKWRRYNLSRESTICKSVLSNLPTY